MISERISHDIPPQMKIMVIPILMQFCSIVSNWSLASRLKRHIIQQNVTSLMTSNCIKPILCAFFVTVETVKAK